MFVLEEFLDYYERVRQRTKRVAACIPADRLESAPKPRAFTFGDLLRHLGATERYMWAETVHNRPSLYASHGRELADGRDAVFVWLGKTHEESMALFRALTPEQLAGKCTTPEGTSIRTWKWLRAMAEHEIHHRGQIYLMLNLIDVPTPPLYGLTSEEVRARATHLQ